MIKYDSLLRAISRNKVALCTCSLAIVFFVATSQGLNKKNCPFVHCLNVLSLSYLTYWTNQKYWFKGDQRFIFPTRYSGRLDTVWDLQSSFHLIANRWKNLLTFALWLRPPVCSEMLSYPLGPTLHSGCTWTCPHRSFGGPEASRCASRSQTSGHTFAHRRGTSARRCNRCSSGYQGGCTDSNLTHLRGRWCEKWRRTAHRHYKTE